jgi:hypothetical protein
LNGAAAANDGDPENFWEDAPENWRRLTDFLLSAAVRDCLSVAG